MSSYFHKSISPHCLNLTQLIQRNVKWLKWLFLHECHRSFNSEIINLHKHPQAILCQNGWPTWKTKKEAIKNLITRPTSNLSYKFLTTLFLDFNIHKFPFRYTCMTFYNNNYYSLQIEIFLFVAETSSSIGLFLSWNYQLFHSIKTHIRTITNKGNI